MTENRASNPVGAALVLGTATWLLTGGVVLLIAATTLLVSAVGLLLVVVGAWLLAEFLTAPARGERRQRREQLDRQSLAGGRVGGPGADSGRREVRS